jgi:hypothetical protein
MKNSFIAAILVSGAVLFAAPSFAKTTGNIEILSTSTAKSSVQFAGTSDDAMLFDVKLDNTNGDKFTVTITTKDGDVLFSKDFSDKSFAKKFKLVKSDDISSYNFKITSTNKDLEQTFVVDATTKTVDDVVVTKL